MGFCWMFFLGACLEVASSRVMITVQRNNDVKENDFVEMTCSYPASTLAAYTLAVNGMKGPAIPATATPNSSRFYTIMSILEGNYTVRSVSTVVVVDYSFNARRGYDGYKITCVVTPFGKGDNVSSAVTLRVRYGPCCNRTASDALVTCPFNNSFMLNASDLVEDAGNPQAVVIWEHNSNWSADPVGDLNQFLKVNLPSIDMIEGLIQGQTVAASAMNDYGKTTLEIHVRVRAITRPPGDLNCDVAVAAVACRWSAVSGIGGAQVLGYRILLKNSVGAVIANNTTETASYFFSTVDTSFIINATYTVEVCARNDMCEGPCASIEIIAPGPPSLPQEFQCSASSSSQVSLTWASPMYNHPDLQFLGFVVSYRNGTFRDVLPRISSQLQQEVRDLLPNTTYYFNVTAENEFGMSIPERANCTTPAPGTPSAVSLNPPEPIPGGVRLSWTAPNPGMTGVDIRTYIVTYQCGTAMEISDDVGKVTTTDLSGLGGNTRCTFTVTATNTMGLTSPKPDTSTKVATTGASEEGSDKTNIVVIVLPVVFGVLAVILVIVILWWYCYYRKDQDCQYLSCSIFVTTYTSDQLHVAVARNDSNNKHELKGTRTSSSPTEQTTSSSSESKQKEEGIQYRGLGIAKKGSSKQPRTGQRVDYADVKHAKIEECRSTEEQLTDSSAYELPPRMQSQATYADVLTPEQQKTSSLLTANPAYSTN